MSAESEVEIQFQDAEREHHAGKLAVWVFLATEVMFFATLFAAYALYHYYYPEAFRQCSHHMERGLATLETADLLTSSTTVLMPPMSQLSFSLALSNASGKR